MCTRRMLKTTLISLTTLLIIGALGLVSDPVPAQEPAGTEVGMIPGTQLSRNEFRALALAQLSATALSAAAYKLVHGTYPLTLSKLIQSESWNLDVQNIFSGQPVQEILFDPKPESMFNQPAVGLGFPVELPPSAALPSPQPAPDGGGNTGGDAGAGQNNGGSSSFDPNAMIAGLQGEGNIGPWRVNPGMVTNITAGDIFFYSKDDLLQVIMYAPDGTYLENVVEGANPTWQRNLMVGGPFPDCVLAAELLFFIGEQLPQYYNLVQFMGDREVIPMGQFADMGVEQRLALAAELGIIVLNPFSKKQIALSSDATRGDFYLDPTQPVLPLRFALNEKLCMTLEELRAAKPIMPGEDEEQNKRTKDHKGTPPMGGRKTKQSH